MHKDPLQLIPNTSQDNFLCAVSGVKELQSDEVWVLGKGSSICALKVTGLTKDDKTSYCCNEKPENCDKDHIQLTVTALQVKVFPTTDGQTVTLMCSTTCSLTDRPAAYIWYRNSELLYQDRSPWYQEMVTSDKTVRYSCAIKGYEALRAPAVTVDIKVKISPSTEVTEGDRVKLTCSTSCPLTNNKNYIWYLNDQLLQLPEHQNKHLVLDAVTTQHAGNYSCAVNTQRDVRSPEKTLRVQSSSLKWTLVAAAGVGAALLVFTSLVICCIRGKGKLSQNTVLKLEEVNHGPVHEEITDQPTEENGIYYSSIRFPQTDVDPLDSMVQPHQHQQEQHIPYAVVCLRNRCT
ncbi:hypothetical protein D4764_0256310 [Takifugu flavidus]|uniref:Ig-like domain-containing protein n=1 Tax=Takifugu flavidus TaxID=433684 RepID=A0A5C6MN41_9TELE|nr:hypothetical protein D4764_0256310 [Takifugu flavidus]